VLAVAAPVFASTAFATFFDFSAPPPSGAHSAANAWLPLAGLLRTLISPFFALGRLVGAVFAPSRRPRLALLVATGGLDLGLGHGHLVPSRSTALKP